MFGFLNAGILIAAAAALIPLIIHLFSRRRVRVIPFSSLRHLTTMQRRQLRRLNIRQWLLLATRMLIVLIVVLAFARPTADEGSIGARAGVSAIVLFDNSASMQRYVADGRLIDLAQDRALQLLETFGPTDEVALIPLVSDNAATRDFAGPGVARERLTQLEASAGVADLSSAVRNAAELAERARHLNRELYVVTDRQSISLPDQPLPDTTDIRLFVFDLPTGEPENLGVVSVDLGGELLQVGREFDIVATIRNYGDRPSGNRLASLFINDRRIAQTDVDVSGNGEATVRFQASVTGPGYHHGWIELSDDRFPADNRLYFSFRIPDQFNVLLVGAPDDTRFLSLALLPDPEVGRYWSVKSATASQLAGVSFSEYDVIVLAGIPGMSQSYHSRLVRFVSRGGSVLLTHGSETAPTEANDRWAELSGQRITRPAPAQFSRAGFFSLKSITTDHPVFSVFDFEEGELPDIRFYALPRSEVTTGRALMRFTGDWPALVERRHGSGRVMSLNTVLDPRYTDLVTHGFFVPFVTRMMEYLSRDVTELDLDLFAGANLTRTIPINTAVSGSLELIRPDSTRVAVPPEEEAGTLIIRPRGLDQLGVYSLRYLGREIDRFPINLDPREAEFEAVDNAQLAASVGRSDYETLSMTGDLSETLATIRFGRELWPLLIWLALALLALEMWLGRGRRPVNDTAS